MKKYFLLAFVALMCVACEKKTEQGIQEIVPLVQLDQKTISSLDAIFDHQNDLINKISSSDVVIVRSSAEMGKICPSGVPAPSIDFEKQCLIFTRIESPSISDEWSGIQLCRNMENNTFELTIQMKACTECFDAIGNFYPYGLFEISPQEINKITRKVVYL